MYPKSRYFYIILILSLVSCDLILPKKEDPQQLIEKRWQEINKNEVEEPPLFEICKDRSREELELCFHETITNHIHTSLQNYTFEVKESIHDTLWIPLIVTKEGKIIMDDFDIPNHLPEQLHDIKTHLQSSIDSLPKVKPAHTSGTSTTARYKLPLVIQLD